jgi:hypothetical protein
MKKLQFGGKMKNNAQNRYAIYERIKAEIARTAKTPEEYERRAKALARKLNI